MVISEAELRLAMRHTAAGISVITTIESKKMFGFTANSFTSVSLNPPLVLFCINNESHSLLGLKNSRKFGVSILSDKQENVSRHFALNGIDKFANTDFIIGSELGCPLIPNSVCMLECLIHHEYEGGDHTIIVGLVKAIQINNQLRPLIYSSGTYHNIEKK